MVTRFRPASVLYPPESVGGKAPGRRLISSTVAFGWLRMLRDWIDQRRRGRKFGELTELNNYLLRDIGVPRDDISQEVARLFRR
jgi:uncharacterized protein YjiS (DUF1127 family)